MFLVSAKREGIEGNLLYLDTLEALAKRYGRGKKKHFIVKSWRSDLILSMFQPGCLAPLFSREKMRDGRTLDAFHLVGFI